MGSNHEFCEVVQTPIRRAYKAPSLAIVDMHALVSWLVAELAFLCSKGGVAGKVASVGEGNHINMAKALREKEFVKVLVFRSIIRNCSRY